MDLKSRPHQSSNMEAERIDSDGFILKIKSESKIAVAVYRDGEEHIYLPQSTESKGTYYQDVSDSLIKTENGYRLELSSEPENYNLIN